MQSNEENPSPWPACGFHYSLPSLRDLDLLPPQKPPSKPTEMATEMATEMVWIDETNRPPTRHHRCKYSQDQLDALNDVLRQTYFPSKERRLALAKALGLAPRTVQIWFQNKRQVYKAKHGVLPPGASP